MNYKQIDLQTWPRREHYLYYTQTLKVEFNMTASVDVENLLDLCRRNDYRFYPSAIYIITKVLNKLENFRMFRDGQGQLCVWDQIIPNYTIFHEDDKTFSDCWSDYSDDFPSFYKGIMHDMQIYKDKKGIKVKDHQPPNFYCISCVPWISFIGLSSRAADRDPSFFPVISFGKYKKDAAGTMMPVNLSIAHAVCDGYHAGLFFESVQNEIDAFHI